ncbi:MAG: hypothetical protein EOP49_12310 [Sphingobacteriales bacterium]|nr:MAG: hypothetical protein EOP49_12310 [Sphingobacteriales bacterium]
MRFLLIFLFFSITSFAPPENSGVANLRYLIYQDGKEIGEIKASRWNRDKQTHFEVKTSLNIRMLGSQKVTYSSHAVYQNAHLLQSVARSYLNDKLHHNCQVTLKSNRYEIKRDKNLSYLGRQIGYSGVMLYFKEPNGISQVFSEMTGQDNMMKRTGDGQYTMTDSKSKKQNRYVYRNGQLEKAYINHSFFDLEVRRVN